MKSYVPPPEEETVKATSASEKGQTEAQTTVKKKRKKRKRDPNKPKGAKSAYLFFCNSVRARVSEANKDKKMTELSGIMAKEWKELGDEEKQKFQAMATEDKARYKEEMKSYVPPPEETAKATSASEKGGTPATKAETKVKKKRKKRKRD